jgi:hypothetical protein
MTNMPTARNMIQSARLHVHEQAIVLLKTITRQKDCCRFPTGDKNKETATTDKEEDNL